MSESFTFEDREMRERVAYRLDPHYKQDLKIAYETLPPPQRGAAMATSAKHAKLTVIRSWLEHIATEEKLDMTPIMASYLVPAFLGRNVSNRELMSWFGIEGRTAADKSPDLNQETINELIGKYQGNVQAELDSLVSEMNMIRDRYKKDLKERERKEGRKISSW